MHTQYDVVVLLGTLAERPLPATISPEGTFYQTSDGNGTFVLQGGAWDPVGPGSVSTSWPKYVVAPVSGPATPYTTIQSAIAAAVADGHGPGSPAVVLVHPGTYTGPLTMVNGIDVVGLSTNPFDTTITGNITAVGLSSATTFRGFRVIGTITVSGGNQFVTLDTLIVAGSVMFSGIGQTLIIQDCNIASIGTDAILVSGTSGSGAVSIQRSEISASGAQAYNVTSGCTSVIGDSILQGSFGGTGVSLQSFQDTINRTVIQGQVVVAPASGAVFVDTEIDVLSEPAIVLSGSSFASFRGGALVRVGTAGAVVGGVGGGNSFTYGDVTLNTSHFIATGVGTLALPEARPITKSSHGPTGTVVIGPTDGDVVVLSPTGPVAVTLPPIAEYGDGRALTVKNNGGATATVSPDGADTLDTVTAVLSVGAVHGVTVRADATLAVWDTVSRF